MPPFLSTRLWFWLATMLDMTSWGAGLDRKGNPTLVSSSGVAEGEEKTPMELRNEEVSQDLSSTLK